MRKSRRWALRIGLVIVLLIMIALTILQVNTYNPNEDALSVLDKEYVVQERNLILLEPDKAVANIVIYPGGLVKHTAYLELADLLRNEGFRVFIQKMPFNLAILNQDAFEQVVKKYPSDLPWVLLGHSLGGASAAFYAEDAEENLDFLIFLAAYPSEKTDLSHKNFNVLSITASNDHILNQESYQNTQALLPSHTRFEIIEGGNHAQFGSYGNQKNDGVASITRAMQLNETVLIIKIFIIGS
jgi:hypothetical protein